VIFQIDKSDYKFSSRDPKVTFYKQFKPMGVTNITGNSNAQLDPFFFRRRKMIGWLFWFQTNGKNVERKSIPSNWFLGLYLQ